MPISGRGHSRAVRDHNIRYQLAIEVRSAIPHQLDGDGENQVAEGLIDGSDRI